MLINTTQAFTYLIIEHDSR